MKTIILSILLTLVLPSSNLEDVRHYFQQASSSEESAIQFNTLVKKDFTVDASLKTAYLGASETLLAKYGDSPAAKLKLFKSGVAHIEEAIEAKPSDIEIRLIRLIIQKNAPKILKYFNEIESDKEFIITHFDASPTVVKNYIRKITNNTSVFSPEELNKIK
jgi:hypothetical protein